MNAFFAALQRFGIGRLAVLLGVGGGGAALLLTILMNLAQPPMGLLYSNLDLREAGSITQALDAAGIKYQAQGDGSTIMVARDKVASARLMLAGKGLPTADSVGYEIFDNQNALGQTDFVQQLNMKRATEGELARTIRALDGVTYARVHLVLPERQLFQDQTDQASASVTIGVGAREPSTDEVRAVQNLVAGAVPNLKPERVAIIDQHGKTLSAESDGVGGKAAEDAKQAIEDSIRARVKNLVEGVVGAGKARVQVSADVDMAQVTTQSEKYDPDGQVVRSEQTNESSAKDSQGGGGSLQAASASTNLPGGTQTAGQNATANGSENTGSESTTNYEISKTVTTEVQQPGQVKRLSVAVAVDGVTTPGKDGKPGPYTPRSADEMQRLDSLVKAAVGFSTDRGDQVQVVNVRFPDAADAEGVSATNPLMGFDKNDIMRTVELAVMAVVAGLILFFVIRPLIRTASAGVAAAGGMALIPIGGGGGAPVAARVVATPDGQTLTIDAATGQPLALPAPDIDQKIDIARIEGQVKASSVRRVAEFVEKHPEESVSILRGWLHESA
ncbi:MAG TPA: flagellar basal-body MS-ring/collar protein FliF [Caulobacteraceae bacterium]|nr:flagellar basal-body MS-ring/collar protein FliF [Caulobacteraceae bacterium]